ncbi:MAG: glycosyltransferase [Syntrophothermus sp.]
MKKVILSVTNDLATDQRVNRVCGTLVKMGFEVLLVGRKRRSSLPLRSRPYRMHRMRLLFEKGPLFYGEYNLRLFLFLLFHKADLLISNDLDTLPGSWLAAVCKSVPVAHDCHEYFRGMPELNNRKGTLKVWKWFEDKIFPRLKTIYAVNASIARIYEQEYHVAVIPIRNVPLRKDHSHMERPQIDGINENDQIILYQGAVNVDRGLEEVILAMKFLKSNAKLLIIGTGDVFENLKQMIARENLSDKVFLTGSIPFEDLFPYTSMATIGISIEKDVSLNYHYCLPNKLLDYIQAGIPVLVSPLPEMEAIINKYNIGRMIGSHEPQELARNIDEMLSDPEKLHLYKENTGPAASELCWENEEKHLMRIFEQYV